MARILVRNLDEGVVRQLKKRAMENRRSLQAETKPILEDVPEERGLNAEEARKAHVEDVPGGLPRRDRML